MPQWALWGDVVHVGTFSMCNSAPLCKGKEPENWKRSRTLHKKNGITRIVKLYSAVLTWWKGSLVIVDSVFEVITQVDQGLTRVNTFDSVISTNDANSSGQDMAHLRGPSVFLTINISFHFSSTKLIELKYRGCVHEAVPGTIGTLSGELQRSN
jgi:hypothetical protein